MSNEFYKKKFFEIIDYFNLLTKEINRLDDVNEDYFNSIVTFNEYTKQSLDIKNNRNIIINDINNIFEEINNIKKSYNEVYCDFKGHCHFCSSNEPGIESYNYCRDRCEKCICFRKLNDQLKIKNYKNYFDEHISNNTQIVSHKNNLPKITNITNITNNLTVNIINNFISTKDLFFNVIISSSHKTADEKLRYIFTYLMCGMSGKKFFLDEQKYSKAVTFPVVAARYAIQKENENHTLYGVLRYKYQPKNIMTIKKLQNMGTQYATTKVITPNYYDNNKYQILKNDIDSMLNLITIEPKGSDINDFYIEDIN